jgi:hypothetical protein
MADYRIPMTAERIIKHPSYLRAITDTRKIKEITQDITKAKAANMNYKSFQVCGAAIIRQQNQIDTLQIELIAGKYSLFRGRVARLSKKTAVLLGININSPYLFNRKISRRWGRFWTTSSRNSPPAAE